MKRYLPFINTLLFLFSLSYQVVAQTNQTVVNGSVTTPVTFSGAGCTYNWTNSNPGIGLPASGTGNIPAFTAVNNGSAAVTATITATPIETGFAYIANEADQTVSVINTTTQKIIATIPVLNGPFTVAISPDGSRVYVENTGFSISAGSISVIDANTNKVIHLIQDVDEPVYGMVVSHDGSKLYVADSYLNTITVFNTTTFQQISQLQLNFDPFQIALSLDGNFLYVTDFHENDIAKVNTTTNTITSFIQAGTGPWGIAISPDGSKLFVGNQLSNDVSVINTTNDAILTTIPVGQDPYGISVSPDGLHTYVANFNSNTVSVIDNSTNSVVSTLHVGQNPIGVSLTPDGQTLYVVNKDDNNISLINTATNQLISTVPVGSYPTSPNNFISAGPGCNSTPITVKIIVNATPPPTITTTTPIGTISACAGSPSASPHIQQFTVSGSDLTGNITATSPPGFEISTSSPNGPYSGSNIFLNLGGSVLSTPVYVRSAASASGSISGNIALTSPGATIQNVPVTGIVNALPTVNPVVNQMVTAGQNTTLINFTGTANTYTWINNSPGIGLPASGSGDIPSFTATNTGTTSLTANITVTPTPVSYAYIPDLAGNVLVVNTISNLVVAGIPVGQIPIGVAVTPDGSRVYVANSASNNVSVIDAAANKVVATLSTGTGSSPFFIAISPDGSKAYVANSAIGSVSVINTINNQVVTSIAVGNSPICIAVSPDGLKLYVVNQSDGTVSVISTVTYATITSIPIGPKPYAEVISPDGKTLYVTTQDSPSKVYVIDTQSNSIITSIGVGSAAQGITITPDGTKVFVTSTTTATVTVIATADNSIISTIPVGNRPYGIAVSPDGLLVYVINQDDNSVSIISTVSNAVTETITSVISPLAIGNFISSANGCIGTHATFTITVNPAPPETITFKSLPVKTYGDPDFSPGATSTNSTLPITYTSDNTIVATIINGQIHIIGAGNTDITASQAGNGTNSAATPVTQPLTVNKAPLTLAADDKTKTAGQPNPVLTFSHTPFAYSEDVSVLTTQPVLNTTATTNSVPGQYVISISDAKSPNYDIQQLAGTLTINPAPKSIIVPNAFTPNGDGVNDVWNIQSLIDFPQCLVSVYSRNGSLVFQSRGYGKPWDGTYNGSPVPTGTYYYIIDPKGGLQKLSGYVAVLR